MSLCPHCRSKGKKYVEAFSDTLDKCASCGLIYLEPAPSHAEMVQRHASEEYAAHPYFAEGERLSREKPLPLHAIALACLERYCAKGAALVDIGAGTGDFIELAAADYAVSAIEPSPFLAERIARRVGCPVFVGAFEQYDKPHSADVIVLMDIIEHASDPRALLAQVRKTLKPDGVVFISTVNSNSILYHLGPLLWRLSSKVPYAGYLLHRVFCKQHNWYFNRRVLASIVREAGFTIRDHQSFEFPLDRLTESPLVIWGLRGVYALQALLGMSTEQYLVCGVEAQAGA